MRITPARAALGYALVASVWIVTSGALLTWSVADPELRGHIELIKGLLFVMVTSGLLYVLQKGGREHRTAAPAPKDGVQVPHKIRLTPLFIAMALVVPLIGMVIIQVHGPQVERDANANLKSVARLKTEQIENWLAERNNDGLAILADQDLAVRVDKFVHLQHYGILSQPILDRFDNLRTSYGYDSILLFDGSGTLLLMLGEHNDISPALKELQRLALTTRQVQRGELYRDEQGHIHLEWIVPIVIQGSREDRAMATVVLRTVAQNFLFPLIKSWPTASPSAETLLVRRTDDYVEFLNPLRHRKDAPLTLRRPSADLEHPPVSGSDGDPGVTSGRDYRGVPVLAAYRRVAGTDWEVVVKIDRDEVLAPVHQLILWISLVMLAAFVAVSSVLLMLWRQQQRMQGLALLAQKTESERLLKYFFDLPFTGMAISSPSSKKWLQINDRLCSMLGYSHEELIGKSWVELTHPDDVDSSVAGFEAVIGGEEGYTVEKRFLTKTGGTIHTDVNVKCVRNDEGKIEYLVATIQDITERKLAERKVHRLTQLYATLSQCNQAIVRSTNEQELFPSVCHDAVEYGGMKMAWIGLVDGATATVKPVTSYGAGCEYLEDIEISIDPAELHGKGLTGVAIRENQPQWSQDFENDPLTEPWRERARQSGFKSMATLPISRNGSVVGVFNLYADEINAFDAAVRELLTEMMTDISYALDHFALEAERKQITQTLAKNEAHLRTLVRAIPDLVWVKDVEGGYLGCNPMFERFFGVRESEILGKTDRELAERIQADAFLEHDQAAMLAGHPGVNEEWFTFAEDGGRFLFETVKTPMLDAAGKLIGILGIARDITKRKQAEQELRIAATAFESQEAMVITDADKRILKINKAFSEITGYSAEEAIGQTPALLKSGRQDARFYEGLWQDLNSNKYWQGEIWNRRKNGEIYPEWLSISAVTDEADKVTHYVGAFSDISQFMETERALRESEDRFKVIANSTVNWEIWWGTSGEILWMNPATEQIIGYSVEECLAFPDLVGALVVQEDRAILTDVIQGGLQGTSGENAEFRCVCKNGSTIWISLSWQPIRNDTGDSLGFRTSARDITERKSAVDALRLTRISVEASSDALFWVTPDSRIMDVNAAACRMLGYSRDQLLQMSVPDIDLLSDAQAWQQRFSELRRHGSLTYESQHKTRKGLVIPVEIVANYVKFNHEERGCAFVRDISERKRAEEQLQKLNEELEDKVRARTRDLELANSTLAIKEEEIRSTVEYMVDCVITINEKGIIRSANPVIEKLFGYAPDEVIGSNISILIPEPHRSQHDGYMQRYLETGHGQALGTQREIVGQHRDGRLIPVELAVSEYYVGPARFFTGILRDITERVRIMKDLEQARVDAEQASRIKSAFLATMSHEIRTPMNGVIGMLDVLQQSSLKGQQVEMVELIHEAAYSLLTIIDDILDFSKIEAGRLEIDQAPFDICHIVEGACETLDHVAEKKGVELQLFTDPALPQQVLGDGGRLRQILVNLTGNAVKFSSNQQRTGQVSLRARLISQEPDKARVEFQVRDNGIGMDQEALEHLFTPFSQADTSTTRRFGGTGLGLAISKELVSLMQGDIRVESAPGQGSVFTMYLDFDLPAEQPELQKPGLVDGISCLLIGNSDGLIDDLSIYLQAAGGSTVRLPDLDAGFEWLKHEPAGLWVIVIDAGKAGYSHLSHESATPIRQLHAMALMQAGLDARFVILGRGERRRGRFEKDAMVALDGNALRCSAFIRAVAMAAGVIKEDQEDAIDADSEVSVAPLSREEAQRQGRLILVAEDNETNQKVILHQLAVLGFTADVANNGKDAFECWRNTDYALLLTDLRMPEMDGYELTVAIRSSGADRSGIPIIAFTANALRGEAEYCRSLGMDDYLTKPVQFSQLRAMLDKWVGAAARPGVEAPARVEDSAATDDPVDIGVLRALVGSDETVVLQLLQDYRESAVKIAAELHAACAAGQPAAAQAAAHKLKSSSRTIGAMVLGDLCAGIEEAGKNADTAGLERLVADFERQMKAVENFLSRVISKGPA